MASALVSIGFTDGLDQAIRSLPALTLVVLIVFSLYWRPRVEVDDGGVRIVNVFRTHYISWVAIELIDTKYALTITALGKKYSAWGAPAPGRHSAIFASRDQGANLPETTYLAGTVRPGDLITSDSGAAAAYIRRIWEQHRDLDGIASVASSWHMKQIAALGLLVLLTVVSL